MKEFDRFDLEDCLYKVWQTGDDLELFLEQYFNGPNCMDEDDVFNVLYGLKRMHDLRMQNTMDIFERVFKLNEYASDEAKALREEFFNKAVEATTPKKKGKKK